MRDWFRMILVGCLVIVGVAVFVLDRRISALELGHAASSRQLSSPVAVRAGGPFTAPSPETSQPERRPSGVINGIPYYYLELSQKNR